MSYGKSITVYLMDGDSSQRYQVTLDNWNIKAYKIPVGLVAASNSLDSIHTAGVYFLFGYVEGQKSVYVGEAEDVYRRLTQHIPEKDGYIWDNAVVFIASEIGVLDKARVKYLENRFYNIIKDANSYRLLNRNEPTKSTITKYSEDAMEVVIDNIKLIIPVLGYTPFKNRISESVAAIKNNSNSRDTPFENLISESEFSSENEEIFYIKNTKLQAKCRFNLDIYMFNSDNPQSGLMPFTLLKGSQISNVKSSLRKSLKQLRQECIDSNAIKDGILQKDLRCFDSASYVAGFILGRSSNGSIELRTNDGQTFKDWLAKRQNKI
ncbi:GIY-YIG nuclease family protein [Ligilactobacillus salivarius]|uniref:GIY-YIG nuclease family protein n=1 Tax=Ligilactobacillus salivarius TaxID=1624 RepID=UPI001474ECE5|nr:GIY-YIG nuclease family protein [Ligilactobacillus salivarius]NME24509.1 GIY-YIG nuclease family protein [Ligilactobacillus salivarius]